MRTALQADRQANRLTYWYAVTQTNRENISVSDTPWAIIFTGQTQTLSVGATCLPEKQPLHVFFKQPRDGKKQPNEKGELASTG